MNREHLLHTLRSQGRFCAGSGSPMYGELFELVATDVEAGGVFATILSGHEDDPSRHAVPLRLLGGLHRLVLDGRAPELRRWYPSTGGSWDAESAWPEILLAAADHSDSLRAALDQPPQTNEVGRSAALIGGLLRLDREFGFPVRLFEIGSSAGPEPAGRPLPLPLRRRLSGDRPTRRWSSTTRGTARCRPKVGCGSSSGVGTTSRPSTSPAADGEMTVLSYVWPDQDARLDRLRGAIAVARSVPARLERQTAADAVAGLTLADGALTVLWHSITWQYLSAEERDAVRDRVDALAGQADDRSPFAHLTLEPCRDGPGAPIRFLVRARSWPGGELEILGECHPHGPPVHWH